MWPALHQLVSQTPLPQPSAVPRRYVLVPGPWAPLGREMLTAAKQTVPGEEQVSQAWGQLQPLVLEFFFLPKGAAPGAQAVLLDDDESLQQLAARLRAIPLGSNPVGQLLQLPEVCGWSWECTGVSQQPESGELLWGLLRPSLIV